MTKAALVALLLASLVAAPFLIASGAGLSDVVTLIVAVFAFGCGALLQEVLRGEP